MLVLEQGQNGCTILNHPELSLLAERLNALCTIGPFQFDWLRMNRHGEMADTIATRRKQRGPYNGDQGKRPTHNRNARRKGKAKARQKVQTNPKS